MKERTKQMLLSRLNTQAFFNCLCQVFHSVRDKVGQVAVFAMVPNLLNRIQFRRIRRKPFHVNTITESALHPANTTAMHHPSVNHKDDPLGKMLQQVGDKRLKIVGSNIMVFNRKIQSQTTAFRRACQHRDGRQPIPAIPTAQNRCLPLGRPRAANRRLKHKPAFVQKNDGFTRSASFFLYAANLSVATGRRPLDSVHEPCFRAFDNSSPSAGVCARRLTGRSQFRSAFQSPRRSVEASTVRSDSRVYGPLSTAAFSAALSAFQINEVPVPADCVPQRKPRRISDRLFSSHIWCLDWPLQAGRFLDYCGLVPAKQWLYAVFAPVDEEFLKVSYPQYRSLGLDSFTFSRSNRPINKLPHAGPALGQFSEADPARLFMKPNWAWTVSSNIRFRDAMNLLRRSSSCCGL